MIGELYLSFILNSIHCTPQSHASFTSALGIMCFTTKNKTDKLSVVSHNAKFFIITMLWEQRRELAETSSPKNFSIYR